MKTIITILFTFFTMFASGQDLLPQVRDFNEIPDTILKNLNKMGIDTSDILNEYESEFLNFIFKSKSQGFDFANKKIAFLPPTKKANKKDFFDDIKERYFNNYSMFFSSLYVFNKEQKKKSGGYDAAIVYWNKFVIPTEKVVERLAKYKNTNKKKKIIKFP